MSPVRVLVIEDGTEYTERARRWMGEGFVFERAGSGPEARGALAEQDFDGVWLDMDFSRTPPELLLGEVESSRLEGDPARAHLAAHQGLYILADLRAAGHALPVLFSHDFGDMPKRWTHLVQRLGPFLDWLPETADPNTVRARFLKWSGR